MGRKTDKVLTGVAFLYLSETLGAISLEVRGDEGVLELPGPVKAWATLNESNGLRPEATRLVFTKSRFLLSLPSIIRLRDQLNISSTHIDAAVDELVARWGDEKDAWEKITQQKEPARSISREEASNRLGAAGFVRLDSLRPHQWESIMKMLSLPHGANFNVPGAGKTTALLAVHSIEKQLRGGLRLLVVAPRNVMGAWDDELKKCLALPPEIIRLTGGGKGVAKALRSSPEISMITYEQLRSSWHLVLEFAETNPLHIVLDESHRAKSGYDSAQGSAVLEIAPAAERRDILSGTPMPQGLSDLCAQFSFLWPLQGDICGKYLAGGEASLSEANKFLEPLFTRVTKEDLGLPPVEYPDDYMSLEMSPHQEVAYRMLRSETSRYVQRADGSGAEKLKALGRQVVNLIQIASNPKLAYQRLKDDPDLRDSTDFLHELRLASLEPSAKFLALRQLVEQLMRQPGEKVVIWSGYVQTIEMIASEFSEYGTLIIHGGIKTGSDEDIEFREARVRLFNSDERFRIIVANPAAGGEGISLHEGAHNAIYFDRSFNATHFLQSVDRIHRLGLPDETVTRVFLLQAAGTIDEAIEMRLNKKIEAMNAVLNMRVIDALGFDDDGDGVEELEAAGLNSEDLEYLIRSHFQDEESGR